MADNKIDIVLSLNDQATNGLKNAQSKLTTFSNNFKNNWLSITAQVTAAFVAVNKAFDLAFSAAKFQQQKEAFRNLARSMGADADEMVKKLKDMSAQTLSTAQIMENASRAMVLGLSPDKLPKLMEISRAAARAFGQDVDFMFDSIVLGIGRQSRMILDNLGIIVSSEKAYEDYAKTLGKTVRELTDAEKRTAFLNATLTAGEDIVKRVNIQNKSQFETLKSLSAFWEDLKIKAGTAILAIIQSVSILVNILRSGLSQTIASVANAFSFLTDKIAVATEFYGELIDRIPGLDDPLEGITDKLQKMSQFTEDFAFSMRNGADEFALAATQIADIMAGKVEPSMNLGHLSIEKVNESLENTAKTAKQSGDRISSSIGTALAQTVVNGQKFGEAMSNAFKAWAVNAVVEITKVIIQLTILKKLMESFGGGGGLFGKIFGSIFSVGGEVGESGIRRSLPTAARGAVATGRAVPIIAHEGEIVGTPERLRQAGLFGGGDININVMYPNLSSDQNINSVAEQLGFAFEREVRTARGF